VLDWDREGQIAFEREYLSRPMKARITCFYRHGHGLAMHKQSPYLDGFSIPTTSFEISRP
jgi:hypothetical protein